MKYQFPALIHRQLFGVGSNCSAILQHSNDALAPQFNSTSSTTQLWKGPPQYAWQQSLVWFCWRLVHFGVILLKLEKKGDRWQLFRAVTAVEEEEEEEEKEEKKKEEKEKKEKEKEKEEHIKLLPPH